MAHDTEVYNTPNRQVTIIEGLLERNENNEKKLDHLKETDPEQYHRRMEASYTKLRNILVQMQNAK